jgi:N4-gp56 family major capsid protein
MALLASSTASNVALGVNFQLMRGLLSAARKKLPFFNGTLAGQLDKNGSTASVKWERLENLAPSTTTLSEITGTTAAFFGRDTVLPTVSTVTAAIAKKGQAVLLTEEIDLMQMNLRAMKFMDMLGAAAGESLNLLMESVFSGFTQIRYSNGSAGGGTADTNVISKITLTDVKYAVNLLQRKSAMKFMPFGYGSTNIGTSPVRESFYGISHPDVEEDIRALSGFIPVEQYGGYTETMPFEYGAVGGVRWCSTEIIPISTSAGTTTSDGTIRGASNVLNDVYSTYIYGKEAVGSVGLGTGHTTNSYEMYDPKKPTAVELIYKPMGTVGTDLYNEVASLAWKAWFAGAVLNSTWGVKIRSGASKL